MNYPNFLTTVDGIVSACDTPTLPKILHELARTYPAEKRDYFVHVLRRYQGEGVQWDTQRLASQVQDVLLSLQNIQSGARTLSREENEEWRDRYDNDDDDYYNDDDDDYYIPPYFFEDEDNILDDITRGIQLLHRCVQTSLCAEGATLGRMLSKLQVHISDADGGQDTVDLDYLITNELLDEDLTRCARETAYLLAQSTSLEEAPRAVREVLLAYGKTNVTLESILQTGEQELALDTFLPLWIRELVQYNTLADRTWLREAQSLTPNEDMALENARICAKTHPELLIGILENGQNQQQPEKYISIGQEAVDLVTENKDKETIMLLTAGFATESGKPDLAEQYYLEIFRNHVSAVNYLRLCLESRDPAVYLPEVQKIQEAYILQPYSHRTIYRQILYFSRQFELLVEKIEEDGERFTMKHVAPLFLLQFYQEDEFGPGMGEMMVKATTVCAFRSSTYFTGLTQQEREGGYDVRIFLERFDDWKKHTVMTPELQEKVLTLIERWIDRSTVWVVNNDKVNSYDSWASYIAAYGEVRDSLGAKGTKARLIEGYRKQFPRKRSFLQSLRKYS